MSTFTNGAVPRLSNLGIPVTRSTVGVARRLVVTKKLLSIVVRISTYNSYLPTYFAKIM